MRYLLTTAALAFLLANSSAFASANPAAATAAAAPAALTASHTAAVADSPDVVQWTATLIRDEQASRSHPVDRHLNHGIGKFAGRILSRTTAIAKRLTHDALRFLGTPYVFGGTSRSGFDCSGFVQHVFAMLGVNVPRTADAQYYAAHKVKGSVRPGDLVFFQTYEPGPSHVGIYLGHGKFVHASSHGVMVSNLSESYWSARYLGAKRVLVARR